LRFLRGFFTRLDYVPRVLSRGRVLAAVLAALATAVAVPAAGAKSSSLPRTLLTTKTPIRAFAQDSSRLVWIDRSWHLEARKLGPKAKTLLVGTAHPSLGGDDAPPQLALAGSRVVWTRTDGGNDFETAVFAREAGAKAKAKLLFNTAADRDERTGSYFGELAAGGSTLAFADADYDCVDQNDCSELASQPSPLGGIGRVVGTSGIAHVPDAPGALEVAVSAGRVALLPAPAEIAADQIGEVTSPQLAQPGTTVEILDATTGNLITQFTPPGTVRALALAGPVAAVVDELPDGTRNIERYDATTGALLGTTVGVAAGDTLSANGNTFVFAVGGAKIESMDAATGTRDVVTVSPGQPIGLSVSGERVAWAVNAHGHGRVLSRTLP
jgi:hypothetical protein